jgi:hypothetical protein
MSAPKLEAAFAERWLRAKHVRCKLSFSRSHLYDLLKRGELPPGGGYDGPCAGLVSKR